jgi:HK97 family phage prohead protease
MDKEIRYLGGGSGHFQKPADVQVRKLENGNFVLEGYAFKYNVLSRDLGGFREMIMPGVVDNIDLSGADIISTFNHNDDKILARTMSKTLTLTPDDSGLKYSFEVPDTTTGRDLVVSAQRGDVQHSSFEFNVAPGGADWLEERDGVVRKVRSFSALYQVGPVVNPAYYDTATQVAKRSYSSFKEEQNKTPQHVVEGEQRKRVIQLLK